MIGSALTVADRFTRRPTYPRQRQMFPFHLHLSKLGEPLRHRRSRPELQRRNQGEAALSSWDALRSSGYWSYLAS